MTNLRQRLLALIILLTALAGAARASSPAVMTYQGRLKEAGSPVTGTRTVGLYFCNAASGGTCIPSGNQGDQNVSVVNGVFRSTYTMPGWDATTGQWFLEVRVADVPLTPREALTASPYAIYAASATTLIADGGPGVAISTPLFINGTLQPAVSAAGQGGLYFDSTIKRFEVSENAGQYVPLGGWYRLAQASLASAASSLTVSLPAGASPHNLRVHVYISGKAASDAARLRFNGDNAVDYTCAGGGGATTGLQLEFANNSAASYSTVDVLNIAGVENLANMFTTSQGAAGIGTTPANYLSSCKWTGAAKISSIALVTAGANNLNAGTEIVVYAGD